MCVFAACARIYARGGEILLNFKGLGTRTHISHAYKHIRALGRRLNCLKGELPSHRFLSNNERNKPDAVDFKQRVQNYSKNYIYENVCVSKLICNLI